MSTSAPQFVYDEDCKFCRGFVRAVAPHCAQSVAFIASQNYEGVGSEHTKHSSIFVFHRPERVCVGAVGIGELLKLTSSPALRFLGNLILAPAFAAISARVYRWIADHRHWSRSGCGGTSDVCSLQ